MNFFRRIRAAWLFSRYNSYRDVPKRFWTPEDAQSWLAFRCSTTGRKLGIIMNNMVYQKAVSATDPGFEAAFRAGNAFGTRCTIADLQSFMKADNFRDADAQISESEPNEEEGELRSSLS